MLVIPEGADPGAARVEAEAARRRAGDIRRRGHRRMLHAERAEHLAGPIGTLHRKRLAAAVRHDILVMAAAVFVMTC